MLDPQAYSELSDTDLASSLRLGDRSAFSEIYTRYKWVLFLHAIKRTGDREQAKDIIQEIFTTLWDKRKEFELSTHLSGYLYTAVRNRIIKLYAHEKVKSVHLQSLSTSDMVQNCVTDHKVRLNNLAKIIEDEINELPEKMKEVFVLSRKHHLSHKEIALQLGIEESTVKRQVSNALKILRGKLRYFLWLSLFYNIYRYF